MPSEIDALNHFGLPPKSNDRFFSITEVRQTLSRHLCVLCGPDDIERIIRRRHEFAAGTDFQQFSGPERSRSGQPRSQELSARGRERAADRVIIGWLYAGQGNNRIFFVIFDEPYRPECHSRCSLFALRPYHSPVGGIFYETADQ